MSLKEFIGVIKNKAKHSGANADVFIVESSSVSVKCRNQELEMIEKSSKTDINFRFIKNNKLASISCRTQKI